VHDLAVHHEVHSGLAGSGLGRVRSSADEQVDVVGVDGEGRGCRGPGGGVGSLPGGGIVEGVEHAGSALVDDCLLARVRSARRSRAEGVTRHRPPLPVPRVETGQQRAAARGGGGGTRFRGG